MQGALWLGALQPSRAGPHKRVGASVRRYDGCFSTEGGWSPGRQAQASQSSLGGWYVETTYADSKITLCAFKSKPFHRLKNMRLHISQQVCFLRASKLAACVGFD